MPGADAAFVLQFATRFDLAFQQRMARLSMDVRMDPVFHSIMASFDILAPSEVQDITGVRHGLTQWSDDTSSRRWAPKRDYQVPKILDKQDSLAIQTNLMNGYLQNGMAGMNRKIDKVIIDAIMGAAASGTYGTETSTFDTSAPVADGTGGNQIAVGAGNLSPDKFRNARAIFDVREVGLDGIEMGMQEFCWVTSAKGHQDMLEFTEATITDYIGVEIMPDGDMRTSKMPLVRGRIPYYMGFRIKISNQLNLTSGNRVNLAWHRDAVGFARWGGDREITIDRLPEHNNAEGLLIQEHFGAVRIHDAGVLAIVCDET